MQKWQYLVIQVVIVRAFGKSSIDIGCDDPELLKALKGKSVTDAFNYLGALGWELTTTSPGSAAASRYLYFKRPVPMQRSATSDKGSTIKSNV